MSEAPIVYVAEPIDRGSDDSARLGLAVRRQLAAAGCTSYSPIDAWSVRGEPRRGVEQVNRAALARADGLIAILPTLGSSIGVPMEIERFREYGRPCAILCVPHESWALEAGDGELQQQFWPGSVADAIAWLVSAMDPTLQRGRRLALVAGWGELPTQAYEGDVGWDLYADWNYDGKPGPSVVPLAPGVAMDVPCGVRIEWPEDMWALVVGRSSTFRKGLLCNVGIIDPGYRGEYFAVLHNIGPETVEIRHGERIAQAIPMNKAGWGIEMHEVGGLSQPSEVHVDFGSSGTRASPRHQRGGGGPGRDWHRRPGEPGPRTIITSDLVAIETVWKAYALSRSPDVPCYECYQYYTLHGTVDVATDLVQCDAWGLAIRDCGTVRE